MNVQTEITRSHERDEVTRVEVQCALEGSITKPLRDHVLGKIFNRQLYLLGSLVLVSQTPYGFLLKSQGTLGSTSLDQLVTLMREKAQEFHSRLEFLKELGDDIKTVFRLGLGPDLGRTEIVALGERVDALESLAQTMAEDTEPPCESIQDELDSGSGEDFPSEGDPCPHPHEFGEPPPAEPDHLEPPGRSLDEAAQEFVDMFMDVFNRCGRYALAVTFGGLVVAAILRVTGVF